MITFLVLLQIIPFLVMTVIAAAVAILGLVSASAMELGVYTPIFSLFGSSDPLIRRAIMVS